MIANIFPAEAKNIALTIGISLAKAATKAISEEKGSIVAAKKAEKKRASSAMKYSQLQMRLKHP